MSDTHGGELFIGASNSKYYTGSFTYASIISPYHDWIINVDGLAQCVNSWLNNETSLNLFLKFFLKRISSNYFSFCTDCEVVLWSGSPNIIGPKSIIDEFHSNIGASESYTDCISLSCNLTSSLPGLVRFISYTALDNTSYII